MNEDLIEDRLESCEGRLAELLRRVGDGALRTAGHGVDIERHRDRIHTLERDVAALVAGAHDLRRRLVNAEGVANQVDALDDRLATIEKRAETTTVHFADDDAADRVVEVPAPSWGFDVPASPSPMQQEIDRLKAERDAAIEERDELCASRNDAVDSAATWCAKYGEAMAEKNAIAAAARGATRIIAEGLEKAGGAA